ncbi:hypothetical protein JXA88_11070 [Candidatus Fermentibacteria bacterium]|nr:hypothetical protein [Candidatus Fermentibacteria bacterium]
MGPYVRYMDDFVVFSDRREELARWRAAIDSMLDGSLHLRLKPDGVWINRRGHGLSFLGVRVFQNLLRVRGENRRRSLRRLRARIGEWERGEIGEEALSRSIASLVGHLRFFDQRAVTV